MRTLVSREVTQPAQGRSQKLCLHLERRTLRAHRGEGASQPAQAAVTEHHRLVAYEEQKCIILIIFYCYSITVVPVSPLCPPPPVPSPAPTVHSHTVGHIYGKNRNFLLTVVEAGKSQIKEPTDRGPPPGSHTAVFCRVLAPQKEREPSLASFIRAPVLFTRVNALKQR